MKKILALILALAMVVSLMACGEKTAPETEPTEPPTTAPIVPPRKTLHVLLPMTVEGWDGAAAQLAMAAVDTIKAEDKMDVVTVNYGSVEQQKEQLAEIAAQSKGDGTQAVVTMPLSADMDADFAALLDSNVAYALAGTIPAGAEAASVINVHYDERQIGAAAAAWLVENGLTQDSKVVIIQGLSDQEALRTEGFQLYLQGKLALNGAVIEEAWTTTENIVYSEMQGQTQESAETYFTTYMEDSDHAKTKYIAAWDDAYVLGVLEALEGENIDSGNKSKFLGTAPFIAGCGGSKALLDVLAGTSAYSSTASFGGIQTIVYSVDLLKNATLAMANYLDGAVVEQDAIQPVVWATAENAGQYQGY